MIGFGSRVIVWVLPPPSSSLYWGPIKGYIYNHIIIIIQLLLSGGNIQVIVIIIGLLTEKLEVQKSGRPCFLQVLIPAMCAGGSHKGGVRDPRDIYIYIEGSSKGSAGPIVRHQP